MADETVPTTPATIATPTAPATPAAAAPEAEKKADNTAEELQEKKVKKAFLDKFKTVKKAGPANGGEGATESETKPVTQEDLAEHIYKQLAEIKSNDYFVLRIRKKSLLMIAGAILILMWLVILGRVGVEKFMPRWAFWQPKQSHSVKAPVIKPTPEAVATGSAKIRIRNNNKVAGAAQKLMTYLTDKGYSNLEVVDDKQSDFAGISIITKPNEKLLLTGLTNVLSDKYILSSASAELTIDSDFDAVILFGSDVKTASAAAKRVGVPTPKPLPTTPPASVSATLH